SRAQDAQAGYASIGQVTSRGFYQNQALEPRATRCKLALGPRLSLPLAHKLDLRLANPLGRSGFEMLAHIAELLFRPIRIVEIIPLLQDRTVLGDAAQSSAARRLTGKPIPFAIAIDEVELGIAMVGHPNAPRRNAAGATQRDEQRGQFLTITRAIGQA